MNTHFFKLRRLVIAMVAAGVISAAGVGAYNHAHAAGVPLIHKSGAVEYMSGGIGTDESSVIEAISKHWSLSLEFAVKSGKRAEFAANVKLSVHDAKGREVLHATSGGPFLLARLAPGNYTVDATLAGKTLQETVAIQTGKAVKAVFIWPVGTDGTRA